WANLGTAAWASADTARSVAGWQHALRLEPLATDVRERVELVHALPATSAGYVLPLPAAWLFDAAAILWFLAWGIQATRLALRRSAETRRLAPAWLIAGVLVL